MNLKASLGKALFDFWNIEQIHIIGCSRSGTTMLQMAMVCFDNTELAPFESSSAYPNLSGRAQVIARFRARRIPRAARKFFVTKRSRFWLSPKAIDRLGARVRRENVGLIHLVRDPRDVLLSTHATQSREGGYVTAEHWRDSITAAERLEDEFAAGGRFVTVRYEDLVREPQSVEAQFGTAFGLERRAGAASIDRLTMNVGSSQQVFSKELLDNLGPLRDMSPASIGKWRRHIGDPAEVLIDDPDILRKFDDYCARHGYAAEI